ncbi:MAG: DUF3298 and DUF4163 domain-containing protein, partial [Lachnospiraceae bacterium]|nr:DUF3298 and DUF4163 domain-containing protein [Lachnospiraceae bacterium]
MKNRIVALMLSLTLAGVLICGCSNAAKSEPEPAPAPAVQEEPASDVEPEAGEAAAEDEKEQAEEPKAPVQEEMASGLGITSSKEFVSRTDDEGKVIVYGHYPVIRASGKDHEKLSAALDEMTKNISADIEKNLDDIAEMAKEDIADGRDLPGGYYTYECDAIVTRGDEDVLSILFTYNTFSGGAHPSSWYDAKSFDAKTGEELNIVNVVNDAASLPKTLADKLLSEYDKEIFFEEDVEKLINESYEENLNYTYTLDNAGICFYFSAYQLAPYAAGSQITMFPYSDYPDLVKEGFVKGDGDFIEGIVMEKKYRAGRKDELSMSFYPKLEDDYEYELNVNLGGSQTIETLTCAGMQPYLVKKDGRYFVYVDELQLNDYKSLDIYKIGDAGLKKVGAYERGFRDACPTDPSDFFLAGRTDLLSTNNTYRSYHVGDDGMPMANEEYDHVIGSVSEKLTLKVDLEAEVFADEEATESAKETLPKGTVLYYFRTD